MLSACNAGKGHCYTLSNTISDYLSLIAVVMPACLFGLASFPVAWVLALIFGIPVAISWQMILYVLTLWIGATILDFVIASLFVLTPHAITYEELVTLPILLISGVFTLPSFLSYLQMIGEWVIPISIPVQWLLGTKEVTLLTGIQFMVSVLISLIVSYNVTHYLINKAKQTGVI